MDERESKLLDLVNNENVSSTLIIADRLDVTPEKAITLLKKALDSGKIQGTLTEDGSRIFKTDVKLSEAPVIPIVDDGPSFMKFNARPGIIASVLGFIVIAFGVIVNFFATDVIEQDFGVVLIFFGLVILIVGLYYLAQRKTPS
jgi:hypothetical protein